MRSGRHVEARGLRKRYGQGLYAVRDVSFTLEPGEFLTLLGPSGSGKTTSLMMVAGFEVPTEGEILVDGRDVAGLPPERRNFGVVFQGYALFPHMSVVENVEFPLRMRGVGAAERRRRAVAMIVKVGLAAFGARKPRELSGGQQQRVALARALVFEPDALLLDEPLGALDRKLRESLQAEIKEIQARVGISILFVTHDQDEAMTMSDRIAVMSEGRIVQIGSPLDVYLHPATPFVAGFLGETNLMRATVGPAVGGHATVHFGAGAHGRARLPIDGRQPVAGDIVSVAVRPERIRCVVPGQESSGEHGTVVDGIVTGCTFLGRHARYHVHALGQTLSVSVADWTPEASFAPGTGVQMTWTPESAQILTEAVKPAPEDGRQALIGEK
jgi:putative spermidine/putrescine transport system ATP-binding protein